MSSGYCSLSLIFWTWKVAWVTTFQGMPHLSTKQDKQDTTLMAWHHTTPQHNSCWLVAVIAVATVPQKGWCDKPLAAKFRNLWWRLWANGCDPSRLNQGSRFIPNKKQDVPLSAPINKGWISGIKEEEIKVKSEQKTSIFIVFLSANLVLLPFHRNFNQLLHRELQQLQSLHRDQQQPNTVTTSSLASVENTTPSAPPLAKSPTLPAKRLDHLYIR